MNNEKSLSLERHWLTYNSSTDSILIRLALINEEASEEMIKIIMEERRKFSEEYFELKERIDNFIRDIEKRTFSKKSVMRHYKNMSGML